MPDLTSILLLFHIIGTALGVGGATASDMLFMRTVRNRLIARDQFILIRTVSRTVMAGMVLVVLTGAGLLLQEYLETGAMTPLAEAHFQAKIAIVTVILLNGIVFHSIIFSFLKRHVDERMQEEEVSHRLPVLAASGAISMVSWYAVVALAVLGPLPLSFVVLMAIYVGLAVGASGAAYAVLKYLFSGPVEHTVGSIESGEKKFTIPALVVLILIVGGVVAIGLF